MSNNNFATDLVEEVNEYGITETMTREQLEAYFRENDEIKYKNLTLGIMNWQDGRFDVLKPADNEQGYETINANSFSSERDAIDFAVDHIIAYDVNRNPDGTKNEVTTTKKGAKKKSAPKKPEFDGPRLVRVYGRDIYMEEDPKVTNEQIRKKLVSEYNFPNFQKGKVYFDLDSSTGVLEVALKFQAKG